MLVVQYIRTIHDRNGNPRRGWLIHRTESGVYAGTRFLGYLDEGYGGDRVLTVALTQWATHRELDLATEGVAILPAVNVTSGFWRQQYLGIHFHDQRA